MTTTKRAWSASFAVATVTTALMLTGCPGPAPQPEPPIDPPPGSNSVQCGDLKVIYSSGPKNVFTRPMNDTYGVNSFYIWEVERLDAGNGTYEYRFLDSGLPIRTWVPGENWQGPKEDSTLWSAARWALDGKDPYHFTDEDPFVLGYLPYVSGSSWISKRNASNDGSCPANNTMINGWSRCYNQNQQDPAAPKTVQTGRFYLIRMMMLVFMGTDSAGNLKNRVQSCYQKLFTPTGWGPQAGIDLSTGTTGNGTPEAPQGIGPDSYGNAMQEHASGKLQLIDTSELQQAQRSFYE